MQKSSCINTPALLSFILRRFYAHIDWKGTILQLIILKVHIIPLETDTKKIYSKECKPGQRVCNIKRILRSAIDILSLKFVPLLLVSGFCSASVLSQIVLESNLSHFFADSVDSQ